MANKTEIETSRLDDAARAGWLYYVAGNTQDEIARKLGVSRQSAQRLVSLAVSERLIKVRLDHPIAHCMELSTAPCGKLGSQELRCRAQRPGRALLHRRHRPGRCGGNGTPPQVPASENHRHRHGTRRCAPCVEQLRPLDCPQHSIVSLLGNMMTDGSATAYNVVIRMAERVNAKHYPMPLPVYARSIEEKRILHNQEPVHNILELARQADVTFVGIGNMDMNAPLLIDGFLTRDDIRAFDRAGAAGEITSWVYDQDGKVIQGLVNDRVNSAPLKVDSPNPVIGIAAGEAKVAAIRAAIKGRLINGLITNEYTAEAIAQAMSDCPQFLTH